MYDETHPNQQARCLCQVVSQLPCKLRHSSKEKVEEEEEEEEEEEDEELDFLLSSFALEAWSCIQLLCVRVDGRSYISFVEEDSLLKNGLFDAVLHQTAQTGRPADRLDRGLNFVPV